MSWSCADADKRMLPMSRHGRNFRKLEIIIDRLLFGLKAGEKGIECETFDIFGLPNGIGLSFYGDYEY